MVAFFVYELAIHVAAGFATVAAGAHVNESKLTHKALGAGALGGLIRWVILQPAFLLTGDVKLGVLSLLAVDRKQVAFNMLIYLVISFGGPLTATAALSKLAIGSGMNAA